MENVDYLRISVIDRCNFRCQYCMPSGEELRYLPGPEVLQRAEILTLVREVFAPLGFQAFRLTGGEPLLRPDIVDLVADLATLPTTKDLALSTNAFLLADLAEPLYQAGLRRINISLDSLDPATFGQIIGRSDRTYWDRTWDGILAAHRVGFSPLKLNMVVIPGVNDHEVLNLAALSRDRPWHIRFIEFMPIGNGELFQTQAWIPSAQLRQQIGDRWGLEPDHIHGKGPAEVWRIPGAQGTLGFISQMSECFCDRCNRIRLSADGWLRPCLLNESGQLDLKTPLRTGQKTEEIRQRVAHLLQEKPEINYKGRDPGTPGGHYTRTMSQIGG